MSIHLSARKGDIAASILLPGDPLRAKYIAENFLEEASCYSEVRGMYGFTGFYKGKPVSVQGTGMGIPSISIYLNELISDYGADKLIRIGTCGSMQPEIELKDVILAMSASTDSHINKIRFNGMDYAPTANFDLLLQAFQTAKSRGIDVRVGNVLTSDTFYNDNPDSWKHWADYGIIAAEMETSALYTLAAKFKVQALSILTVSDNMIDHQSATSEERQKSFTQMMEIALEIA